MRKFIYLFFFSLYILIPSYARATTETLQLTTYYPAPTATYNKLSFSTNAVATNKTAASFCTASNTNSIFTDGTGQLNYCTAVSAASSYCAVAANNGTLMVDSTGTLHTCVNGTTSIYPQQCYNAFCSYNTGDGATTCSTSCAAGFSAKALPVTDAFQISLHGWVISTVCCSS